MSATSFWAAPYRPMFSGAALWALLCVAWWPLGVRVGLPAPGFAPVVLWHIHELLFGFSALAVGGYLLTALPNWTGSDPEQGLILKLLMSSWGLARLCMAIAEHVPLRLLVTCNALYFGLLTGLILWRILRAQVWTKLPFGVAIFGLGFCEALFLSNATIGDIASCLDITHGILIGFAILITAIGVRAIPAFTRIWKTQSGQRDLGLPHNTIYRILALLALIAAAVAWVTGFASIPHGLLLAAAVLLLMAMSRWQSLRTWRNPLLFGLHAAFLWVPVGLLLMGVIWFFPAAYPMGDARHALTIGAMSGLILTFTGRAGSHRKTGPLRAPRALIGAMIGIWLATVVRLLMPLAERPEVLETVAALLWCASWAGYLAALTPALRGHPVRPVLSGKKSASPAQTH